MGKAVAVGASGGPWVYSRWHRRRTPPLVPPLVGADFHSVVDAELGGDGGGGDADSDGHSLDPLVDGSIVGHGFDVGGAVAVASMEAPRRFWNRRRRRRQ